MSVSNVTLPAFATERLQCAHSHQPISPACKVLSSNQPTIVAAVDQ